MFINKRIGVGLVFAFALATASSRAGDAAYFVARDTWLETVIASREALMTAGVPAVSATAAGKPVKRNFRRRDRQSDQPLDTIWRLTAEKFPDHVSFREAALEDQAGIWRDDWDPADWSELATRYAARAGKLATQARALVQNCRSLADLRRVRDLFYVQHAATRLALAEKTLAFVERSAARPEFAARLKKLQAELAEAERGQCSGEMLYAKACELRREIIFSHPLLDFSALLINERSDQLPEHMCDQYLGRHSQVAPGLVVLENWKQQPRAKPLLAGKLPPGGLLQPSLSFDGQRVLFAFAEHASVRAQNHELRSYSIYEYDFATDRVRQVTGTDGDPREGRLGRETVLIEDTAPCYLPDGGLAFISTRSQQYGRCHGARYVPSYTLYRGELDGSHIRPLSFNESNEWAPSVLSDGSIIYCRWDYVNRHDTLFQSLWTIRPDGTQTAHYYGNNSRSPCLISEPQMIPGSHKTVCTAAAHHGQTLGTIVVVDPHKGQEHGEPLTWITPELSFPEAGVPEGITRAELPPLEDAQPGRAATPWPLSEDIFLCTYQHGNQHAIYLIDTLGGRELIYWTPSIPCFDPIPLRSRPAPPAIISTVAGKESEPTGVFSVQNVYESTQPIPAGTIAALRINEIISQPTRAVPVRSFAHNELVKKILGTVPVNKDGSVAFEAPAQLPLQLQLLDTNGMAVMTMRSLVYLQPGEKAACVGCHEARTAAPPPLPLSTVPIRKITPPAGPPTEAGLSFVRNVQPVLDRYCIGCHASGNLDLTGTRAGAFTAAYNSLLSVPGFIKIAQRNQETVFSVPKDYFAAAGRLAQFLLAGHPDKTGKKIVVLDRASLQRVIDWLDLNAQFYGDYSFNRLENQPPLPAGETALRAAIEKRFGAALAQQPFATLVNGVALDESRILLAPLPVAAGGWGQITTNPFRSKSDPDYQEMRQLAAASVTPLPAHDIAGTCGTPEHCRCGNCWVHRDLQARLPVPPKLTAQQTP